MRVLLLDDEPSGAPLRDALHARPLTELRQAPAATTAPAALAASEQADVVVIGPAAAARADLGGVIATFADRLPVVVVGEHDQAAAAVAALKAGAADYVALGAHDLAARVAAAAEQPGRTVAAGDPGSVAGLVGASPAIERVRALVRTAARTGAPVLVEGETGTGKEVVARAVHALGPRARAPFIPVNCAAVPESLAESEFFGHARGAFTGALDSRPGALRLADRGTLFLDEIEDLPLPLQAKLLRVVQDGEVRPLGGNAARHVDVRLVAASNRELWRMVESGTFRRDLYYRLRVLTIQLPPLRERGSDLPLLVAHFVAAFNRRHGTRFVVPPTSQLRPLLDHPWPGNVRELENTLESLLILATADGHDLATVVRRAPALDGGFWPDERARIVRVLNDHRWNRQRAAAALGISRVTLWRRMERHGIRDPLTPGPRETS
jgi:two-component system response regulator PilR (NtrC family)